MTFPTLPPPAPTSPNVPFDSLSPSAIRLFRLIWRLSEKDGWATVRTSRLTEMLTEDTGRDKPYTERQTRVLLRMLRLGGWIETQTDYRTGLFIAPTAEEPANFKPTPKPPRQWNGRGNE